MHEGTMVTFTIFKVSNPNYPMFCYCRQNEIKLTLIKRRFVVYICWELLTTIAPSCLDRWSDVAMVLWRWHDDDGAMLRWRWSDVLSHHRYRVIAPSRYRPFLHMRCLKKMATGLHCSLTLLWFFYHLSNILLACIKSIAFLIIHFNKYVC